MQELTIYHFQDILVSAGRQIRKYTDKNNTERTSVEVRADKIKLLDSKGKVQEEAQAAYIHRDA